MIYAVLDTNTLVSAIINTTSSVASEIYQSAKEKRFILITSPLILTELYDVLQRDRIVKLHKRSPEELQVIMQELINVSYVVPGTIKIELVRDPDDDKIISAAVEGKANYIISRDKDLLDLIEYEEIKIISPEQFIRLLRSE